MTRKIRATCAAVRAGFSRFSPAASSSTAASVRGVTCRAGGASAANPPAPPGPDPPVDRLPRHAHRVAERPRMRPGGQLADQPAPLPGGQRRISGLPDQLVPEQAPTCSARAARLRSSSAPDIDLPPRCSRWNQQSPRIPARRGAAQSQLVLATPAGQAGASSSPQVTAAASCHRATAPTPGTAAAATAAAATAATASEIGDPAGPAAAGRSPAPRPAR